MCDNCDNPTITLSCAHCNDFYFCSNECSDALAKEHHAVCYNTLHDDVDHLNTLMLLCGLPMIEHEVETENDFTRLAHEAIEEYLIENDFTLEALQFIEAGAFHPRRPSRRPRIKKPKKVKKPKKKKKVARTRRTRPILQKKERVKGKRTSKFEKIVERGKVAIQNQKQRMQNNRNGNTAPSGTVPSYSVPSNNTPSDPDQTNYNSN